MHKIIFAFHLEKNRLQSPWRFPFQWPQCWIHCITDLLSFTPNIEQLQTDAKLKETESHLLTFMWEGPKSSTANINRFWRQKYSCEDKNKKYKLEEKCETKTRWDTQSSWIPKTQRALLLQQTELVNFSYHCFGCYSCVLQRWHLVVRHRIEALLLIMG